MTKLSVDRLFGWHFFFYFFCCYFLSLFQLFYNTLWMDSGARRFLLWLEICELSWYFCTTAHSQFNGFSKRVDFSSFHLIFRIIFYSLVVFPRRGSMQSIRLTFSYFNLFSCSLCVCVHQSWQIKLLSNRTTYIHPKLTHFHRIEM